ncbi:MAG: hypothetical protein LBH19_12915 [Dysgonamonadaceae bacterium]|jgi:hypothetical protein|nr:hypothetical protein [Dysgonamonadaceae bacterium]
MNKICCGQDIRKGSIFACIIGKNEEKNYEDRFKTLSSELNKLRETLVSSDCSCVAMQCSIGDGLRETALKQAFGGISLFWLTKKSGYTISALDFGYGFSRR